jgi:hypothetical protein
MAKNKGLKAAALAAPKPDPICRGWLGRLRKVDPEMHAEVVDLIEAWKSNDSELHDHYPTTRSLAKWIAQQPWCDAGMSAVEKALYYD